MKLKSVAKAGTYSSNDIMIFLYPSDQLEIELESTVYELYGRHIIELIQKTLEEHQLTNVRVHAIDKGALDFTIRARLITAIKRGMEDNNVS